MKFRIGIVLGLVFCLGGAAALLPANGAALTCDYRQPWSKRATLESVRVDGVDVPLPFPAPRLQMSVQWRGDRPRVVRIPPHADSESCEWTFEPVSIVAEEERR